MGHGARFDSEWIDLAGPADLRVCLPRAEPLPNLMLGGAHLHLPAEAPLTR